MDRTASKLARIPEPATVACMIATRVTSSITRLPVNRSKSTMSKSNWPPPPWMRTSVRASEVMPHDTSMWTRAFLTSSWASVARPKFGHTWMWCRLLSPSCIATPQPRPQWWVCGNGWPVTPIAFCTMRIKPAPVTANGATEGTAANARPAPGRRPSRSFARSIGEPL